MFHVSTLLPLHEDDPQRLERKRHLGNDIIVIVFIEKGKINPSCFRSKFTQVLVCVQKIGVENDASDPIPLYHISVVVKSEVGPCYPSNLQDTIVRGDEKLRAALLAFMINLERAVLQSVDIFIKLWKKSRMLMLNELIELCSSEEAEGEKEEGPQKGHKRFSFLNPFLI